MSLHECINIFSFSCSASHELHAYDHTLHHFLYFHSNICFFFLLTYLNPSIVQAPFPFVLLPTPQLSSKILHYLITSMSLTNFSSTLSIKNFTSRNLQIRMKIWRTLLLSKHTRSFLKCWRAELRISCRFSSRLKQLMLATENRLISVTSRTCRAWLAWSSPQNFPWSSCRCWGL